MPVTVPEHRKVASGYILVTCESNNCSRVLKKAERLHGYRNSFRLQKNAKDEPDVVINIVANSESDVIEAENTIKGLDGVKAVTYRLGLI